MNNKVVAWGAEPNHEGFSTVIFSSSRGKAKKLFTKTDEYNGYDYLDMRVHRIPALDGHSELEGYVMDWDKQEDRLALVRYAGFYCIEGRLDDCKKCIAKDYCGEYEYLMDEMEEEDE